jgi:hypothetical protein
LTNYGFNPFQTVIVSQSQVAIGEQVKSSIKSR